MKFNNHKDWSMNIKVKGKVNATWLHFGSAILTLLLCFCIYSSYTQVINPRVNLRIIVKLLKKYWNLFKCPIAIRKKIYQKKLSAMQKWKSLFFSRCLAFVKVIKVRVILFYQHERGNFINNVEHARCCYDRIKPCS